MDNHTHFLKLLDFTPAEIGQFLDTAADLKAKKKAGEKKEAVFTQKMSLQGGEYLLSMGVTGYNGDTFEVYHRLYDALNITVVSDKNTVGYYDMDSVVHVRDVSREEAEGGRQAGEG